MKRKLSYISVCAAVALAMPVGIALPTTAIAGERPDFVKLVQPEYPRGAERRKIEGWVDVQYTVGVDGKTADATVVSAEPPGVFDAAAIKAVQKWKFEKQGEPISEIVTKVRFKLQ